MGTLLYLILIVQLNVLQQQQQQQQQQQKEILSQTLHYFFTNGLSSICQYIDSIIDTTTFFKEDWNVVAHNNDISLQDFINGIQYIRQIIEEEGNNYDNNIILNNKTNTNH